MQKSFFGIENEWLERMTLVKVDIFSDIQFKLSDHHFKVMTDILSSEDGYLNLKQSWKLRRQYPEDKEEVSGYKQVKTSNSFKNELLEFLNDDTRPSINFNPLELFPMFLYISTGVKTYERHFETKLSDIPHTQSKRKYINGFKIIFNLDILF